MKYYFVHYDNSLYMFCYYQGVERPDRWEFPFLPVTYQRVTAKFSGKNPVIFFSYDQVILFPLPFPVLNDD